MEHSGKSPWGSNKVLKKRSKWNILRRALLNPFYVGGFLVVLILSGITDPAHIKGKRAYDSGNYKGAAKMFRKAANQNNVEGQYWLGRMYKEGLGVPQYYEQAIWWLRKAHQEEGYPPAQNSLGVAYAAGNGVDQDYEEAVKWFRFAASQGHKSAMKNLGIAYHRGQGVARNSTIAAEWINRDSPYFSSLGYFIISGIFGKGFLDYEE